MLRFRASRGSCEILDIMTPTTDLQSVHDELLRRIGRNVVNFQYLEATLRSMIPALSNKGTLSELKIRQAELARKHKKSSLGELANAYHKKVFRVPSEDLPGDALTEPTVAFSVQIESTTDDVAIQKRALASLVVERNRLIHRDVLNVDMTSKEQCEALSTRLDEQNTRIRQQLDQLNAFRSGMREAAEELIRFIESEEFLAMLRDERDDA